jgi:putative ABC transport system permease protein
MRGRIRAALAALSFAPWRRAPRLLWRRPRVVATVAGACAVLATSLAGVPLFLSSAGSESVEVQAADRCPRDTGATYRFFETPAGSGTPPHNPLTPVDKLTPATSWVRLDGVRLADEDGSPGTAAFVLSRDDVFDHIEVVDGPSGDGVWITDRAATITGLGPADPATIDGIPLRVAGVYRDLSGTEVDDYWCSQADMLLLRGPEREPPPPVVIADRQTLAELAIDLELDGVEGAWEAGLRDGLTVSDTGNLVDELACGTATAPELGWCGGVPPPAAEADPSDFVAGAFGSHLPFVFDRAQAIQRSVGGGVWPVAGFAALAGIGLVAASASLWFDRRRREVTLLTVRGVAPSGLGLKAVLEMAGPLAIGCAGGVGLAYLLVVWLGPSPVIEPAAIGRAAVAGVLAAAVAALTVGFVVAGLVRVHHGRARRWGWLAAIPWELGLAVATLVSYRRLGEWGVPLSQGADVTRVDVVGLLFPVLFLVTAVAVIVRLLFLALGPVRSASSGWPTPLYLAVRRVSRYRLAAIGLVAASALAGGVLGYAATLNRSLDATLQAKAKTFIGSDTSVRLADDEELPPELASRATEVDVYRGAWVDDGERQGVTVLGIDPDTLEQAAFWDPTFSDASLADIFERLSSPSQGGPVPAIVVGTELGPIAEAGIHSNGTTRFDIEQVADAQAFPGMKRGSPTMIVAASALGDLGIDGSITEVWVRGERLRTLAALDAAGTRYDEQLRVADVVDRVSFLTVSWTFGFMQSLGIAAGLLVVGGLAVYLDARRRDRVLGYGFARRMGLTSRQHRRALFVELSASVVVGCWLGLVAALVGAWLAHDRIDPVPGFRPTPLFRPALAIALALAAVALVVAVVTSLLAQRRADRDDPVEVLRAGV